MNSLKKTARRAGLLWLLGSATAGFSLVYVRPKLIVSGDAAATVKNILAFESLFRAGIASMILSQILLLFFGLAIFRIFKSVNKTLATGCFASLLVGGGVGIVNSLNNLGALARHQPRLHKSLPTGAGQCPGNDILANEQFWRRAR